MREWLRTGETLKGRSEAGLLVAMLEGERFGVQAEVIENLFGII